MNCNFFEKIPELVVEGRTYLFFFAFFVKRGLVALLVVGVGRFQCF